MIGQLSSSTSLQAGYVLVFGIAALACFYSVVNARTLDDPDTRRGLVWLLLTSGTWAATHVVFLVAPSRVVAEGVYVVGLVVGFATVGPWLYFCSAYTGRTFHRNPTLRRVAVGVFLLVVLVKVTDPIHHTYFTLQAVDRPFPHFAVDHGLFHWLVMGLSYALATIGYFVLLESAARVDYDTRPIVALVAVTGFPLVFDIAGLYYPSVVTLTYEPLGVAVFAVGVLYVFGVRFQAIQVASDEMDPVVVVDRDDEITDFNAAAAEHFPELGNTDSVGRPLSSVLPDVAATLDDTTSTLEREREGITRYYRVSRTSFGPDGSDLGGIVRFDDVTDREQYRHELERQNDRLEQFASLVSHDLRNPMTVAQGHLTEARESSDDEHLAIVAESLERMEVLVEDLLALARQGQPIDETERVDLGDLARSCWRVVDTGEADLVVDDAPTLLADSDRLQQLLENLYRNSIEHGGHDVTISVGSLPDEAGFYVADDGEGIPADERDEVFESGFTTADDGTGFGLAIVTEIADAHDWDVRVTESEAGGARFEVVTG